MALVTLLQTRTDYPAVTPIDPDECLILDQQTDQPEGEQATVMTLSEAVATGGRMVETDEAYETLYADSVVNVSAASITITVGSVMRVGSRLLIRRTAAYDGNPVTITPPSGATFEGRASISLYGQYSFVELERISSTVFAIKDLDDSHSITPTLSFAGSSTGVVYTTQTGTVTCRRGRCSGELRLAISNKGTATGVLEINLPGCPVASGTSNKTAFSVLQAGITYSGYLSAYVAYGTNKLNIAQITEAGVLQLITDANVANSTTIFLSFEYPT